MSYTGHVWEYEEPITVEKMNNIEEGVASLIYDGIKTPEELGNKITDYTKLVKSEVKYPSAKAVWDYVQNFINSDSLEPDYSAIEDGTGDSSSPEVPSSEDPEVPAPEVPEDPIEIPPEEL